MRHPRAPWWRRLPGMFMAAGDRLLDSSGNRLLDTSGNRVLSNAETDLCCCGTKCSTGTCGACPDGTPGSMLVTFSGVTFPGTCMRCPAGACGNFYTKYVSGSLGSYCVLFNTPCNWKYNDAFHPPSTLGVEVDTYFDGSCTDGPGNVGSFQIEINLTSTSIQVSVFGITSTGGLGNCLILFEGTATLPTLTTCYQSYTVNNQYNIEQCVDPPFNYFTCPNCTSFSSRWTVVGTGGFATVTPCCT